MSQTTETPVSPDLDAMWRQWRDVTVENMAWLTGQAASGEAFIQYSKAMNDAFLATFQRLRELSGEMMDSMELPKRSDLARLSAQVLSVENRVGNIEDRLDGVQEELGRLARLLEDLKPSLEVVHTLGPRFERVEEKLQKRSEVGGEPADETGGADQAATTKPQIQIQRRKKP